MARFLCDRMLERLARLLRAAGHDAVLAADCVPDRDLVATAVAEDRLLVTRDQGIVEHRRAQGRVALLQAVRPLAQAAELSAVVRVDWLHRPFSRCLLCNVPLLPDNGAGAPPGASGPYRRCPCCRRLFWEGGHVARMRGTLERLQAEAAGMHGAEG